MKLVVGIIFFLLLTYMAYKLKSKHEKMKRKLLTLNDKNKRRF